MPDSIDCLTDVYADWCSRNNLELMSADDALYENTVKPYLTDIQVKWLNGFISAWDVCNQNDLA